MRGALVTVEGVEGSGKSTQCTRLAEHLTTRGIEVVRTSEPDGTPLGARVRALFEADGPTPTPLTQTFLFMAARREHVTRVIAPALARGAVVLSDRYADATVAYQGYGQGVTLFGEAALAAPRERSLDQVMSALRDCREAWHAIQGNVSPRLSVEVLLGRLTGQAA